MGKFAKLFEIGDEQLLVKAQLSDDGEPQVVISTEVDKMEMCVNASFNPKDESDEAFDSAWESVDKYLASFDQEKAEEYLNKMTKAYQDIKTNQPEE